MVFMEVFRILKIIFNPLQIDSLYIWEKYIWCWVLKNRKIYFSITWIFSIIILNFIVRHKVCFDTFSLQSILYLFLLQKLGQIGYMVHSIKIRPKEIWTLEPDLYIYFCKIKCTIFSIIVLWSRLYLCNTSDYCRF